MQELEPYEKRLKENNAAWIGAFQKLAHHTDNISRDLQRLKKETPENRRLVADVFALRGIQIANTEVIEYLNGIIHFTKESDPTNRHLPSLDSGRYREMLSILHPARPFAPSLALTEKGQKEYQHILKAREDMRKSPDEIDSATRFLIKENEKQTLHQADIDSANMAGSHETIGFLFAITRLLETIEQDQQKDASSPLPKLKDFCSKLHENYVKNLIPLAEGKNESEKHANAYILATIYQHPGLLREHLRARRILKPSTVDEERRFLATVDNAWKTYHIISKPIAWAQTMAQLTPDELKILNTALSQASRKITASVKIRALDSIIDNATYLTVKQFKTALDNQPFLDHHRKHLAVAGRITATAGLTLFFGLLGGTIGLVATQSDFIKQMAPVVDGIKDEIKSHVGDMVVHEARAAIDDLDKDLMKETKDEAVTALFRSLVENLHLETLIPKNRFKNKLFINDKSTSETLLNETNRILHHLSFEALANPASIITDGHQTPFTPEYIARMMRINQRINICVELLEKFEKSQFTALEKLASESPAAFKGNPFYSDIKLHAIQEAKLNELKGFDPRYASPADKLKLCQNQIIKILVDRILSNAENGLISTEGNRAICQWLIPYDPSPLDIETKSLLKKENVLYKQGLNLNIGDFKARKLYVFGMLPSYHIRQSLLDSLFPRTNNDLDRQLAKSIMDLTTSPTTTKEIKTLLSSLTTDLLASNRKAPEYLSNLAVPNEQTINR